LRTAAGGCLLLWALVPGVAAAGFNATSATREVRAEMTTLTTVYGCLVMQGPYYFPGCPGPTVVTPVISSTVVQHLLPFVETETAFGATASQDSSISASGIAASGSVAFVASGSEDFQPGPPLEWTFAFEEADVLSRTVVDFALSEDSPYSLQGTAQVQYLTGVPVHSEVRFLLRLVSLPGDVELERFELTYADPCPYPPNPGPYCSSGPAPIDLAGLLPAGDYRLEIELVAEGEGSWLPTVGPMISDGAGSFDVALQLGATPLPLGGWVWLAAAIGWIGAGLARRPPRGSGNS
jgi:hypothetical protein